MAALPVLIGGLCRCVPCCCPEGRGHKHPAWVAYEAEKRAREAFEERGCGHGSNSRCDCYGELH